VTGLPQDLPPQDRNTTQEAAKDHPEECPPELLPYIDNRIPFLSAIRRFSSNANEAEISEMDKIIGKWKSKTRPVTADEGRIAQDQFNRLVKERDDEPLGLHELAKIEEELSALGATLMRAPVEIRLAVQGLQARPDKTKSKATSTADNERQTFVEAMLRKKSYSVHDWARISKVDFHTANRYLRGRTNPYPSTRLKLAQALEIGVDELP
jgi:hypothetical protein